MNTNPDLTRPKNPKYGDIYYDLDNACDMVYTDLWSCVRGNYNTDGKPFFWMDGFKPIRGTGEFNQDFTQGHKNPTFIILNIRYLTDNYTAMIEWITETDCASYHPKIAGFIFNDDSHATMFRLKFC